MENKISSVREQMMIIFIASHSHSNFIQRTKNESISTEKFGVMKMPREAFLKLTG